VPTSLWHDVKKELNISAPSLGYGCTEASPAISHLPPGQEPEQEGDLGFPIPGIHLSVQKEHGLEFSGPNLCLAMIEDGRIRFPKKFLIPDKIEKTPGGHLLFKGRHQLTLNRGGEKFLLEQMEREIQQKLGVAAVCVALHDPRLGQELGIVCEGRNQNREKSKIYSMLKNHYGRQFSSDRFVYVDDLPKNSNAKLDRRRCQSLLETHQ